MELIVQCKDRNKKQFNKKHSTDKSGWIGWLRATQAQSSWISRLRVSQAQSGWIGRLPGTQEQSSWIGLLPKPKAAGLADQRPDCLPGTTPTTPT